MANWWRFKEDNWASTDLHRCPPFFRFFIINIFFVTKMLSKLKSGKCWTHLASYPLQYGNGPWWDNPPICKAWFAWGEWNWSMSRTPGKGTLGSELKSTKIPGRARISAVLFSPTILDAFYGFKKVWFFIALPHTAVLIRKIQINLGWKV